MKYRVTTRGWIVFFILGVLLLTLIVSFFSNPAEVPTDSEQTPPAVENPASTDDTATDETDPVDESEDDEVNSDDVTESEEETTETTEVTETTETEEITSNVDEVIDWKRELIVLFDKNVSILKTDYHEALNEWVSLLNTHEDLQITIEGHINGYPYYEDGDFGMALAQKRAEVVKNYLMTEGIDESRIRLINMGSNHQADKSNNLENHYLNRRAIINLVEKP